MFTLLFHDFIGRQQTDGFKDLSQLTGDSGLTCPRITRQHNVYRGHLSVSNTHFHHFLVHGYLVRQRTYLCFYAVHTDEFIQFSKYNVQTLDIFAFFTFNIGTRQYMHHRRIIIRCTLQFQQPDSLILDCTIHCVPYLTGITEIACTGQVHLREVITDKCLGLFIQGQMLFLHLSAEDFRQFIGFIVAESHRFIETGGHPRVGTQKFSHLFCISGSNSHKLPATIFYQFQQRINCLLAELVIITLLQCIGFVNEQYSAHSHIHIFFHRQGRLTYISRNQLLSRNFHQLTDGQHFQRIQDISKDAGNCCLSRPRIAKEQKMIFDLPLCSGTFPFPFKIYLINDFLHRCLDFIDTDKLIQLCHDLLITLLPELFTGNILRNGNRCIRIALDSIGKDISRLFHSQMPIPEII